jgi:uncharacterized protein
MYNLADTRWREQPNFMSEKVARQTAFRMLEHCKKHKLLKTYIVFHGGEPLLGGISHLEMLTSVISDVFSNSGIDVYLGMQSNGLLFNEQIGDFLLEKNISLGISLDGPPKVHDANRVDHQGNPTSFKLEEKLKILTSPKYLKLLRTIICVINIDSDPLEVIKYLLSFKPPSLLLLLPDYNYDRLPPKKEKDIESTPYGDWLINVFNYWYTNKTTTKIRLFESIIRIAFGKKSLVETIGLDPIQYVIIETNGDIELLDALKSSYHGATVIGYNVFENDLDIVAQHKAIIYRRIGKEALCAKCKECPVVNICGGGYIPHRYSKENGFDNPSIYSSDLEKLIRHVYNTISSELKNHDIVIPPLKTNS